MPVTRLIETQVGTATIITATITDAGNLYVR